ncbi:ribosomal RNA processing protein [Stereum hirsutum FP-91666 SS1]|uniref:ribosomal RNA processing protein n=1 Tax=Stereum hirsutum (strain FP-91666) TaxID=721885 RepID=UPI000440DCA1|nr:ribosomal RNA processing protein [Stereum hirsutum FP-91666 SS1]EIM92188.1 ribosomal RNA processing protein [Stereum hirsutum FP-91666 SS1]
MAAASSSTSGAPPLGKYLASTDKKTRDKAIKSLSSFISDPAATISKNDMTKLWKGVFYCFWMSDKPLVQQALASELAEILLSVKSTSSSLAFLRGFWEMTVREWSGIDRLRIDKYYMLIRRFVNASFRLLMRDGWSSASCQEYNDILTCTGGPLCPNDSRVPASLSYHISDIYLEELDKVLAPLPRSKPTNSSSDEEEAEGEPNSDLLPVPLATLFSPLFTLAARTISNHTYQRIQSSVFDPLFKSLSPPHSDAPPSRKRLRLTISDSDYANVATHSCLVNPKEEGTLERTVLRKGVLKAFFAVASDQETRDSNRRKMYALWRKNEEEDEGVSGDSDGGVDAR